MRGAHWWLVCYDVRDAERLRKAARHMEGYGTRVQYSVFRCWLTPREVERLSWELTELLASEDDVLLIPVCGTCVAGIKRAHDAGDGAPWPAGPDGHCIV